jgi:hypothetical protein
MEDKYYFIKRMNEKILWQYKPKTLTKLLYVFSTIWWVPLPILSLGIILCLCKLTDWKIMVLFVFVSLLSYLIAFFSFYNFNYQTGQSVGQSVNMNETGI